MGMMGCLVTVSFVVNEYIAPVTFASNVFAVLKRESVLQVGEVMVEHSTHTEWRVPDKGEGDTLPAIPWLKKES